MLNQDEENCVKERREHTLPSFYERECGAGGEMQQGTPSLMWVQQYGWEDGRDFPLRTEHATPGLVCIKSGVQGKCWRWFKQISLLWVWDRVNVFAILPAAAKCFWETAFYCFPAETQYLIVSVCMDSAHTNASNAGAKLLVWEVCHEGA